MSYICTMIQVDKLYGCGCGGPKKPNPRPVDKPIKKPIR